MHMYTHIHMHMHSVTLTIRKIERQLLDEGHAVCILTTRSGDMSHTHMVGEHPDRSVAFLDNAFPIPCQGDPNNKDISYYLGLSLDAKMKAFIADSFRPTLIHITCPDFTCLHLIEYARTEGLPLMGTFHSNIPDYFSHYLGWSNFKTLLRPFFRHMYCFLQTLYVPTPYIQNYVIDAYDYTADNLAVWGRGVDLDRFNPSHRSLTWRRNLGIKDHQVVLCWVGRLFAEKRPEIFAQVVRRLHAENLPYHALVIGTGPSEQDLRNLPNTTVMGWMSGHALSVAYASSDIFLFPSAVETFGNVSLEAAASGLPIIVEAGCSGHVVKNGKTGYACDQGGVDEYHEAARRLVKDSGLRAIMSEAARDFSLNFENRNVVQNMLDNYAAVTEELYVKYDGQHAARDLLHSGCYMLGSHPRTLALHLIEYFLVVVGFVISVITWVGKLLCSWKSHDAQAKKTMQKPPLVMSGSTKPSENMKAPDVVPSLITSVLTLILSIGDTKMVYLLARLFAESVMAYSRSESRVRNFLSKIWPCRSGRRKRKVSDYDGDLHESFRTDSPSSSAPRDDDSLGRRVLSASKFE